MTGLLLPLAVVSSLLCTVALAAVSQPDGYRLEDYDSEVPAALDGAVRVTAIEVRRLMDDDAAVVIDVIPEHRRPDSLPKNQLWMPVPHEGIKGALWLPDVGFGALSAVTEDYLFTHLAKATGGDTAHPLVFYCRMDCWMSWNAAKRALAHGYRSVYWFADGLDDWRFEDFEMSTLTPAPGQRQ